MKSKRGNVKFQVAAGPENMSVSSKGVVSWQVPSNFSEDTINVILSASDASQQEVFQSFSIAVGGDVTAGALVQAPPARTGDTPPAKPNPSSTERPQTTSAPIASWEGGLPSISPAELATSPKRVKLPASLSEIVTGGGGRFLILYLKQLRQLAIFDTSRAAIVKYIAVSSDDITYTAGADTLIVALRDKKLLQSYSLKTFERILTVPTPTADPIGRVLMGSASPGPVAVVTSDDHQSSVVFVDPKTLKEVPYRNQNSNTQNQKLDLGISRGNVMFFRASGDGRTLVLVNQLILLGDSTVRQVGGASNAYQKLPNADGSILYSTQGFFTNELKRIGQQQPSGYPVPAVQPGYYLSLPGGTSGYRSTSKATTGISIHVDGDQRPLVTLANVDVRQSIAENIGRQPGLMLDQRFWYVPDAQLLVQVPSTDDSLILHAVDIESLLTASEVDYLFVASRPPTTASLGKPWQYQINVKSKKGGTAYKLASAPMGMVVSKAGKLSWAIPADFSDVRPRVIVEITDGSGQEVLHTFAPAISEAQALALKQAEQQAARIAAEKASAARAANAANLDALTTRVEQHGKAALQTANEAAAINLRHIKQTAGTKQPAFPVRVWTDTDGNKIEAQLVEVFAGIANLCSTKGVNFIAPTGRLGEADQKYLQEIVAAAKAERENMAANVGTPEDNMRILSIGIQNLMARNRRNRGLFNDSTTTMFN